MTRRRPKLEESVVLGSEVASANGDISLLLNIDAEAWGDSSKSNTTASWKS